MSYPSRSEAACQVCAPIHQALFDQMQITMRKFDSSKLTIKEKSVLISNLKDKVNIQHEVIEKLMTYNAGHLCIIENLTAKSNKISIDSDALKTKISELSKKLTESENERDKIVLQSSSIQIENKQLIEKVNDLEIKLHKLG